jgi:hypothetical protein
MEGQGQPTKKTVFVHYNDVEELKEKLKVIDGQMMNGNKSRELIQQASDILGQLKSLGAITQKEFEQLFNSLL